MSTNNQNVTESAVETQEDGMETILQQINDISAVHLSADDSADARMHFEQAKEALLGVANADGCPIEFLIRQFETSRKYPGDVVKQFPAVHVSMQFVVKAINVRNVFDRTGKLTGMEEQSLRLYKSCLTQCLQETKNQFVKTLAANGQSDQAESIENDVRYAKRIETKIRNMLGLETVTWAKVAPKKGSARQAELAAKATIAKLFAR